MHDVYEDFIREEFDFKDRDVAIFSPNPSELIWLQAASRVSTFDVRADTNPTYISDVCSMPEIADNSFDFALANHLFPHVYDDERAFREIGRILRPYGRLFFTVPLTSTRRTKLIESPAEITQLWGQELYDRYRIGTFRRYGIVDLITLLNKHFLLQTYYGRDGPTGRVEVIFCAEKVPPRAQVGATA